MTKIVSNTDNQVKKLSEINPRIKFYGAQLSRDGEPIKGYFRRTEFMVGGWNLFSICKFNESNSFGYLSDCLENSMKKVLDKQGNEVYEFDSLTELFNWLES